MISINEVKNVGDPLNPPLTNDSDKVQVHYSVDNPAEINSLPGLNKIRGGSTAFVINTSEVYMLGSTGWVKI